jgi:phosphatidylglycerophosphate synthase
MVKLWMIILISFRDILVTLMRTIMQYKGVTMVTSKAGKLKTFLQIVTISFILIFLNLISYKIDIPELILKDSLFYLMVITTLITFYTGVHYVYYNYKTLENLFLNK